MTKLVMLLAKGPGMPQGDLGDRLVLRLALNQQGQIDPAAYEADPVPWLATRVQGGSEEKQSELLRLDEGWALQSIDSEDDPLWTLEGYVFRPGELVRLGRPDGEELLFRIVSSTPD